MKKYLIENRMPAAIWQDATPLGNGQVGAMMYGSIYDERILLNHESLYDGETDLPLPDCSRYLQEVRKLLDNREYKKADTFYTEKLEENKYFVQTGNFLPAFDIRMITYVQGAFTDYKRQLDMEKGIASLQWKDGEVQYGREIFVSAANGLVVLRLTASKAVLGFDVRLERHDLSDAVDYSGNKIEDIPQYNFTVNNNALEGSLQTASGRKIKAVLCLFSDGDIQLYNCKNVKKLNDMQGTLAFDSNYYSVRNAKTATIVCRLCGENENVSALPVKEEYEGWRSDHIHIFSSDFNAMKLDLGGDCDGKTVEEERLASYNGKISAAQIEKMALFGRYLLISSSARCRYPANLQGVWNGSYRPAWSCTFFNNENIEMNYWQALCGNLPQVQMPLFDFYLTLMDDYRENARKLFGCRGILLPMFLDNHSGKKKNLQPHVIYWTASSSWIANIFYDYYLFTRDVDFLRKKAFPFMKEAALFYEDFMQYDEQGYLKSYPSNSPENCAVGDFEGSENVRVCINATMDFAALKQLLCDLLEAENLLDISDEKHDIWKKMLSAIPPYRINAEGALCEWMHKDFRDNYAHRHMSHLYPLFPGREITKEDGELFKACTRAVELRYRMGMKEQTGWSFAHMANVWAKLGNGERAEECLKLLLRFCTGKNMLTYHNDWHNQGVTLKYLWAKHAPFQIDANLGFTAAVQQMLIDSGEDWLEIFPALPPDWKNVKIGPCLTRCGVYAVLEKKDENMCVKIKAYVNTNIEIRCGKEVMWEKENKVTLRQGEMFVLCGKICESAENRKIV